MNDFTMNVTDSRVVATYSTQDKLRAACAVLKRKLSVSPSSMKVISPQTDDVGKKLEPRSEKVGSNMLNLHFIYGSVGVIIGMVAAYILATYGPQWAQQNPIFTFIALVSPGLFTGLFLAGFMSLKPERDIVNQEVVSQNNKGEWVLVVNTENESLSRDDVIEEIENTDVIDIQK